MDKNIEWFYNLKAQNMTKILLSKEYDAILVKNLEELKNSMLSKVFLDESFVLDQTPFIESLDFIHSIAKKGCRIYDYKKEPNAILADNFIVECDFITENGELIFLDDFSSCASLFGPKRVFVIAGINKFIKNFAEFETMAPEILKIRNYFSETSDNFSLIHHGRKFPDKYTIFIVPEDIGF